MKKLLRMAALIAAAALTCMTTVSCGGSAITSDVPGECSQERFVVEVFAGDETLVEVFCDQITDDGPCLASYGRHNIDGICPDEDSPNLVFSTYGPTQFWVRDMACFDTCLESCDEQYCMVACVVTATFNTFVDDEPVATCGVDYFEIDDPYGGTVEIVVTTTPRDPPVCE